MATFQVKIADIDLGYLLEAAIGASDYWATYESGHLVERDGGTRLKADLDAMLRGLSRAASGAAPNCAAAVLAKNWDGGHAETILQCAFFGEPKYG